MKTKRPLPYTEGSIKKISDFFLKPLIEYKPEHQNLRQFLERLLHITERDITQYRATKDFSFVGKYVGTPNAPVWGIKTGLIKAGRQVWARVDSTHEDRIDVEIYSGKGSKTKIFQLTRREFNEKVKPFVEEVVMPEREQKYLVQGAWVYARRLRRD